MEDSWVSGRDAASRIGVNPRYLPELAAASERGEARGRWSSLRTRRAPLAGKRWRYEYLASTLPPPTSSQKREPDGGGALDVARSTIVDAFETYRLRHQELTESAAILGFIGEYGEGKIDVPPNVWTEQPRIARSSLQRWLAIARGDNRAKTKRRRLSAIESQPDLKALIEKIVLRKSRRLIKSGLWTVPFREVYNCLKEYARGGSDIVIPSKRTVARYIARFRLRDEVVVTASNDPDRFRSRFRARAGSQSAHIERACQEVQLDCTPIDAHPRYTLVLAADVKSGRILILVAPSASAEAACALIVRKVCVKWAVPETIKHDLGKEFTAMITRRVGNTLEIELIPCVGKDPAGKGLIERVAGIVNYGPVAMMPNFSGHNVLEKRGLKARAKNPFLAKMAPPRAQGPATIEELQRQMNKIVAYLDQQPRSDSGKTPLELFLSHPPKRARLDPGDPRLALLLAPAPRSPTRTVQPDGINLNGHVFKAPELGERIGDEVMVRFDPEDRGHLHVFELDDLTKICIAVAPELVGMPPEEQRKLGRETRRRQREYLTRRQAEILSHSADPDQLMQRVFDRAYENEAKIIDLGAGRAPIDTHGLRNLEKTQPQRKSKSGRPTTPLEVPRPAVEDVYEAEVLTHHTAALVLLRKRQVKDREACVEMWERAAIENWYPNGVPEREIAELIQRLERAAYNRHENDEATGEAAGG